jgi:hypothetical protein
MPITPPENSITGQIWSWMRIDCGPTIGWVRRPMWNDKYISTGSTYTVQPLIGDCLSIARRPRFKFFLPDVVCGCCSLMASSLSIKDIGNASLTDISSTPITVSPFSGQTIDGLVAATNPVQITSGQGSLTVEPKSDFPAGTCCHDLRSRNLQSGAE